MQSITMILQFNINSFPVKHLRGSFWYLLLHVSSFKLLTNTPKMPSTLKVQKTNYLTHPLGGTLLEADACT